jgi:type IV secretion system protein VirB11
MSNTTALNSYLEYFQPYFMMDGISEICINKPFGVWIEQYGQFYYLENEAFTLDFLLKFARLVGEYNDREITPEKPTLSSILPDGSRVQFVIEPACEKGSFICSIRRKATINVTLDGYFLQDIFVNANQRCGTGSTSLPQQELLRLFRDEWYLEFLKQAVLAKKNILISGGTSSGKTALLNELLNVVPLEERILTIETDREVFSEHPNTVHLLAAEEGASVANITMLGLLKAGLRLRPDRILPSELRAEEAFPYLRAVNSGHPGSLTTIHADNPKSAFDQLAFMAMQSGSHLTRQELLFYAKSVINVVVQVKRIPNSPTRYISEIYYDEAEKG